MINRNFIIIVTVAVLYLSCWLGTEMLAEYTGYSRRMTHFQMFLIPAICIFLGIALLFVNDGDGKQVFFWKYLLNGGKIPLCMWSLHKALNNKNCEGIPLRDMIEFAKGRLIVLYSH